MFVSFLGPLLGISLGFDAMNSEQQSGTLQRVMAQPLYRDNLLLSKFVGALMLIGVLFLSLVLLMVGAGLLITGVGIEAEEVLRIFGFTLRLHFVRGLLAESRDIAVFNFQASGYIGTHSYRCVAIFYSVLSNHCKHRCESFYTAFTHVVAT